MSNLFASALEDLTFLNFCTRFNFLAESYVNAPISKPSLGKVIDVAVDIRKRSPTYGKHVAVELSGENKRQLFIPRGFAHGFVVLSESATFAYKVDNSYAPEYDSGIKFDDNELNINWGLTENEIQLSAKDENLPAFKDLNSPFNF